VCLNPSPFYGRASGKHVLEMKFCKKPQLFGLHKQCREPIRSQPHCFKILARFSG
jgi:hypothetical protein